MMSEIRIKTIHDSAYQLLVDTLRSARQTSGITQVDLAAALGTDQSFVSKYERSERRLDIIELRAVCSVLGLDFVEFVTNFEKRLRKQGL
jgi:transcriptional regulator with XRE-family HTH domain